MGRFKVACMLSEVCNGSTTISWNGRTIGELTMLSVTIRIEYLSFLPRDYTTTKLVSYQPFIYIGEPSRSLLTIHG